MHFHLFAYFRNIFNYCNCCIDFLSLRFGSLYAPTAVISTEDKKTFHIIKQARNLRYAHKSYDTSSRQSAQRGVQLPSVEMSNLQKPIKHFSNGR